MAAFTIRPTGVEKMLTRDDDIGNAFAQLEISPQTSIQAEYRYRNNERGDILQRFFSQDFFPGEKNTEETAHRALWRAP